MVEHKLNEEEVDDLLAVIKHRGIKHVLSMVDEIVELMRNEVLTVPVPKNPQEAAITVYAKRCSAEGAMALRLALQTRINNLKYQIERETHERK